MEVDIIQIEGKTIEEILKERDLAYLKRKRISTQKSKLLNNINYHCEMVYEHTRRCVELKEEIYLNLAIDHINRCKSILCKELRKRENKRRK